MTQYRAIFPDDDAVKVTYVSATGGRGGTDRVEGVLFYSWVDEKVRGVGGRGGGDRVVGVLSTAG